MEIESFWLQSHLRDWGRCLCVEEEEEELVLARQEACEWPYS